MRRSSLSRWAALAVAVAAFGLTTQSAFAAVQPATGVSADAGCPIWFWWCWTPTSPSPSPSAAAPGPAATAPTSPTPGPTPAPTVAPTTPGPSPSGSGSPSPRPSASATTKPAVSPTPAPSATSAPTRSALPAPGPEVAILSSNSIQITALRSIAVRTVNTAAAGSVKVIELVADASTITGLGLQGPCVGHSQVNTNAASDTATGGLTLDATALQATILGVPIIIAAADLPNGALTLPGITLPALPTNLGILSVKLFVLTIQSGTMALQAPRITPSAC
jgi:hypothetical protein